MNSGIRNLVLPITLLWFVSGHLIAGSADLDKAVKAYYAGKPGQAISMLKPVALSGDVSAQYLLGNILYGLLGASRYSGSEDPVKWYKMAAEQNSPEASYALAAIYNNNWLEHSSEEDLELAGMYYRKALDLGYLQAQLPLEKLIAQSNTNSQSLTYTNASFGRKPESLEEPTARVQKKLVNEAIHGTELSSDLVENTAKIEALIRQLTDDGNLDTTKILADDWSEETGIINLLIDYDSTDKLLSDLMQLLDNLRAGGDVGQP